MITNNARRTRIELETDNSKPGNLKKDRISLCVNIQYDYVVDKKATGTSVTKREVVRRWGVSYD